MFCARSRNENDFRFLSESNILPDFNPNIPVIALKSVVFPDPLGPIIPANEPRGISKLISDNWNFGYPQLRFCMVRMLLIGFY
jgi:hypothetical protein